MPKKSKSSHAQNISITGKISGQIAIGNNNAQFITSEEVKELHWLLADLRAKVDSTTEPEKKDAALEQVQRLEQAVTAKKPDLSKMEKVKNWFGKNAPALAGAVTSVVVHPIVGKLVEAGGDMLAKEFQERFGEKS